MSESLATFATSASVPGSLMLFGEHAVLYGHPAVVAAVDKRMTVTRVPRPELGPGIEIRSALGHYETREPLASWPEDPNFRFLLEIFRRHSPEGGVCIDVESQFSSTVGFGSSSAVTVGALAVLTSLDGRELHAEAVDVVRAIQGRGSGADVAASVFGGIVAYSTAHDQFHIDPLRCELPPISAIYSGYKTPTSEVIRIVNQRREEHPEIVNSALRKVGAIAGAAIDAIERNAWHEVGDLMNMHQALADLLGINSPELKEITGHLRDAEGIHGTKISGAGLGDCAIAIGRDDATVPSFDSLPVAISPDGLRKTYGPIKEGR